MTDPETAQAAMALDKTYFKQFMEKEDSRKREPMCEKVGYAPSVERSSEKLTA